MSRNSIGSLERRELLRLGGLGVLGCGASGWLPLLAAEASKQPKARRHCILLWMNGGPSQLDTFDMKPGRDTGGPFQEIATAAPGLRFSEHLPKLAKQAQHLAVLRGLSTKEGDHGRGTHLMRTGHTPDPTIRYPTLGSVLSKELGQEADELPSYVSIVPSEAFSPAAYSPGFLGPRFAAAKVRSKGAAQDADVKLTLDNLQLPSGVEAKQAAGRLKLWETLETGARARQSAAAAAHELVYRRAVRLMNSKAAAAFDLSQEPDAVREAYGKGRFGQGCLMARRLLESGVSFVEVSLGDLDSPDGNWDTHQNNFKTVQALSGQLDAAWGTLLMDLAERGLLESTTIVWLGEFGRTPQINGNGGRDHFPNAWSCVLGGGGIRGGQAFGRTSDDGKSVADGQVSVGDVWATLCKALGLDPSAQNVSEIGRPIQIAEGKPIAEILA